MGRFEKRTESTRIKGDRFGEVDNALRAITEELQIMQRTLLKSLQEDIKQLQAEKIRLAEDVNSLQQQKEYLLQGRQASELQGLLRQLAQVLASHISSQLQSSLETLATHSIEPISENHKNNSLNEISINQLLGSFDDSLTITFQTLQQELKNYQNNLSQQLSQMSNQQRQGEEILAELVNRLRLELEKATVESPNTVIQATLAPENETITQQQQVLLPESELTTQKQILSFESELTTQQQQVLIPESEAIIQQQELPSENESEPTTQKQGYVETVTKLQLDTVIEPTTPKKTLPPEPASKISKTSTFVPKSPPPPAKRQTFSASTPKQQKNQNPSPTTMGIVLIGVATLAAALYNVAVKVIFHPGTQILGVFQVQQLLPPTLGNSLLILTLRMLVVVPLMLLLAPILYPQVWDEMQNLVESARTKSARTNANSKQVLVLSIVSGCFLFFSQLSIYIAIGQITTGMAIALLFIYPAISGLLAWLLFRDRPTLFRLGAIACIFLGEMLVLGGSPSIGMGNIAAGSIAALAAGVTFACYAIVTRMCAAKLHPVTFTLINFATILVLSLVGLIVPLPSNWAIQLNFGNLLELILSAFILGVLTLFGYLLNNIGIRKLGAARSAMFGAIVPALTVIFAGIIIQESLELFQVLGVLLVTCGAAGFSFEKVRNHNKTAKISN